MRAAGRWRGLSGPPVPACDLIKADLISLFSLETLQAPSQGQGLPVGWALLWTHVSGLRSRKMPAWGPDHPSLLFCACVQILAPGSPPCLLPPAPAPSSLWR